MFLRFPVRFVLIALAVLAMAGYGAYWFHAATALGKGIEEAAQALRARGWIVELSPPVLGGLPRSASARIERVSLKAPGGLSWRAEGVEAVVPLADPLHPMVRLPGFHRLEAETWRGIVAGALLELRLTLDGDAALLSAELAGRDLALEQTGIDPLTLSSLSLRADRLPGLGGGPEEPSLGLGLVLTRMGLPDIPGLPLDRTIRAFQVEARLLGTPALGKTVLAAVADWSAAGGTVELDRVLLDWPPLQIEGDGTFALDPMLEPLLATSARLRGFGDLLPRLVREGMIEAGQAEAATFLLALLARPDPQGRPTLSMPITLQDGLLSVGQVRLLRLPPLALAPPNGGSPP